MMRRLRIGQLDIALIDRGLYVDWRMSEPGNRWRLVVARRRWVPFSERYGYADTPRSRRVMGMEVAWYGRGVEA